TMNLASSQSQALPIAVAGSNVYWGNYPTGGIGRVPTSGGNPAPLLTQASLAGIVGLAINASYIYFLSGVTVRRVGIDGGASTLLWGAEGSFHVNAIAVDAAHVYWTNDSDHSVNRMTLVGQGFTSMVSGQVGIGPIVTDDTSVYWVTDTEVMKL